MSKITLNINPNVFLPTFRPYVEDYTYRYSVYYGGRGSGKTFFIIQKMLIKGLKEKRLILLMRKETNKLKDSVWKELVSAIESFGLTQYFEFNRSEYRATCTINGTEFKCLGLDESEKIKGFADASDIVMDEATAFTQDDYELIDGTLRSPGYKLPLELVALFNPVSKNNWVYKYFGFDTNIVPEKTFIHKSTYLDNNKLDPSFIDYMDKLKRTNPTRYKIEALGLFCSLDKLVYNNWEVKEFDSTKLEGELAIGLDFGYVNDPSALVASIINTEEKTVYIFDEYYQKGRTNDQLAHMIIDRGYSKSKIIADSAEQKSIEEIRRLGVSRIKPCTKGPDSIIHGIQKLQQYRIIVHPKCEHIINEFENYSFKKNKQTNEYENTPIDDYNHLLDALRYSIQVVTNSTKMHLYDKDVLF